MGEEPLTESDDLLTLGNLLRRMLEGGAEIGMYVDLGPNDLLLDGTVTITEQEHDAIAHIPGMDDDA